MEQEIDFEKLENAEVRFAKDAFRAKAMRCSSCRRPARPVETEITLPDSFLNVRLKVFRCVNCKKEYMNFEESQKLDRALLLSRALRSDGYKERKSLSFDGDNYIFRIPVDIARSLGKKPHADMIPLSSRDLLIHIGAKTNT